MNDKKQTILVVDDVPDDIVILEEILKKDYQVKAVTSGEAALRIAQSDNPPDLILLDIMMPGMDGFEVCRILKQDARGAMIPVIFLTAKVMAVDEKVAFELGAVDYIRKPVDPEIVRKRVKSHLEMKDEVLRSSEIRFRRLFETSKDGIMIVDLGTEMIVDVNSSMAAIMGVSLEYFLGKKISEMDFLARIMSQNDSLPGFRQGEYVRYKDQPMETADGRMIYVEFVCNSYKVNQREVMQLNIRDITNLIAAERERDELSARLSHYLSTSPTVTYSLKLNEGTIQWLWVSENIRTLLGYSSEEALSADWWFKNISAEDRVDAAGSIVELIKQGTSVREYRFKKKDRSCVWLRDEMRLVHGNGQEAEIVGTLTDINERKKAEEDIHLKSAALEAAANAMVITDHEGIIKWVNRAFETLTGYDKAETIGKDPHDILHSGKQSDEFYSSLWDTIMSGNVWSGELINRRRSGEFYTEEMTITPVIDNSRTITNFIAVKSDITERIRARERIEAALREKGELLREIHHRVNNNMQVMISLLNISSQDITDGKLREKLKDITRRMFSMAAIHQQFYESEDMSRIDFSIYLQELFSQIKADFPDSSRAVHVVSEVGPIFLGLEQAIPVGLVVCELLTRLFRYVPEEKAGNSTMRITQDITTGTLVIDVEDGNPESVPQADADRSLGTMLIHTLTEQLGGTVEFRLGKGSSSVLRFPIRLI